MKILLHSHTFWPNIGGIETVSHLLAESWTAEGHQVSLVTEVEAAEKLDCSYSVWRNPSKAALAELISRHDLVHANGASMRLFTLAARAGKPFVWTHQGYQLQCIDGLGWEQGRPAPLSPAASIAHHCRLYGLRRALVGMAKLSLRRWIAARVAANVAVSRHVAFRQPLPRQCVIYNPVDRRRFAVAVFEDALDNLARAQNTFTFIGRLVSEKGVDDLIHAFASLAAAPGDAALSLKIMGDGPERGALENLAKELGISRSVCFSGAKTGDALLDEIGKAGICVLPSAWEEPMGLVAAELMAAGKPLVVSERGGLSEVCADACLTFANQNRPQLAAAMMRLRQDRELQSRLVRAGLDRSVDFDLEKQSFAYLELFADILARRGSR